MKLGLVSKAVFLFIVVLCHAGALSAQQLAFPTAEGYGKYTVGGRGGTVIEVTNLNSSGPGSLSEAVAASGPRTVVFRVSGTIDADVSIDNDYITIAGQTAPGDGITIKGSLGINANEVIIRYIRIRDEASGDALGGRYNRNIVLDHVSTSWSSDEVLSIYHNEYVTIQWCLITEAGSADHKFGGIWGNNPGTYHHNLIAHNASRNPRWASGCGNNDYRNNVLYNWGYNSCYGGEAVQSGSDEFVFSNINMVANYYKPGPATASGVRDRIAEPSSRAAGDEGSWHVSDNYVDGYPAVTADNWLGVDGNNYIRLDAPWPAMGINQQTAEDAYSAVLDHAGCSFPTRDSVDERIIEEVRNGTANYGDNGLITHPNDVGGWPTLTSAPAPDDTDHDGMPDNWEMAKGLNPNDPGDRNGIGEGGYTNLEVYLNGMVGDNPTSVKEAAGSVPSGFILEQNSPNPFNPSTKIGFILPYRTNVRIDVYDVLGRKVAELVNEEKSAGRYEIEFNAKNLKSGVYIYRLTYSDKTLSRKMLLLK
jgi:pectate lyase